MLATTTGLRSYIGSSCIGPPPSPPPIASIVSYVYVSEAPIVVNFDLPLFAEPNTVFEKPHFAKEPIVLKVLLVLPDQFVIKPVNVVAFPVVSEGIYVFDGNG